MYSTATTALLTWKLHRQQSLSTLSLYNTNTQLVTHIFNINSSEAKSQYTVKGLQPGTRFKAEVVVTTSLKQLNITLKQRLKIGMETGINILQPHGHNLIIGLKTDCRHAECVASVSSSVSSWLAGQWKKLLLCEKNRFHLE